MDAGRPERINPLRRCPRGVLFDLDGTLVDTGPDIVAAINRMLVDLEREPYAVARILDWVGEGAPRLVERTLADSLSEVPSRAQVKHGLALFQQHYGAAICVHSTLYPGVRRLLESLRASGLGVACVTNKPEHLTRALLAALALAPLFDVVVGGDSLANKKPHPEPLEHACRMLRVRCADAAYVGDSLTDCRAAAAAAVPMIAVTYGYHQGADLTTQPCAAIIDGLAGLPAVLNLPQQS